MSVNVYRPHLVVLPEDDANRQIANGFLLAPQLVQRVIQVLAPSGGWLRTIDDFTQKFSRSLRTYVDRRVVLLIDFDDRVSDRCRHVKSVVPAEVFERVFVLGVRTEPEELRGQCGCSYESIGLELAEVCTTGKCSLWQHELLHHNEAELGRLMTDVKPFLFA